MAQGLVLGTFVVVGLPQLLPRPLTQADPRLHATLYEQVEQAQAGVAEAEAAVDRVTGLGAQAPEEGLSDAGRAQATTWLQPDDRLVEDLTALIRDCQEAIGEAQTAMDPGLTLIGGPDQENPTSTPKVVALGAVRGVSDRLTACAESTAAAIEAAEDGLEQTKREAADAQAGSGFDAAVEKLTASAEAAQAVLDVTSGKVADDRVRQDLASRVAQSRELLGQAVSPDGWEEVDAQTRRLGEATAQLEEAVAVVTAAQSEWQAAEDARIAAERAAAQQPRSSSSGGSRASGSSFSGSSGQGSLSGASGGSGGGGGGGGASSPVSPPDPMLKPVISCAASGCMGVCPQRGGTITYSFAAGWTEAEARASFATRCPG